MVQFSSCRFWKGLRLQSHTEDVDFIYLPAASPNIGLSATENSWSTFLVIPISHDQTVVETRTKVMPASNWEFFKQSMSSWLNWKGRKRPKFDGGPDDPLSSGDFMAEDVYACDGGSLPNQLELPVRLDATNSGSFEPVLCSRIDSQQPLGRVQGVPACPSTWRG